MKRSYILSAAAACSLLAVGCGSRGPQYFVASSSTSVLLVQWGQPSNAQASGTITYDSLSGSAPDETLNVQTVPVAVTLNGSSVTFTMTGLAAFLGGGSISGTLSNGGLIITTPPDSTSGEIQSGTLAASNPAAYNAAVASLQESISKQNAVA